MKVKRSLLEESWRSYQEGDRKSFGIVYQYYHRKLTLYCLGKLSDLQLAENAASDTLMKLMSYKNPESIYDLNHWIFTVAKNECLMYLQKIERRIKILKSIPFVFIKTKNNDYIYDVNIKYLNTIIKKTLSEKEYQIWRWHEQGYLDKEISQKVGLTPKTVANLKSMARNKLKKRLQYKDPFDK